jgi:hypothetical protein
MTKYEHTVLFKITIQKSSAPNVQEVRYRLRVLTHNNYKLYSDRYQPN